MNRRLAAANVVNNIVAKRSTMKTPTKLSNEVKDFLFTVALGNDQRS